MTEVQTDIEDFTRAPAVPAAKPKSSGFQRMKARHHKLIAEHENLLREYHSLLTKHVELEAAIERAAKDRFNEKIADFHAPSWFETAGHILSELSASPDRRSLQTFIASLAHLQQRASAIIMRLPI
jgi:hypothetical protein